MPNYNLKPNTFPDTSQDDLGAALDPSVWGVIPRASYGEYNPSVCPWNCYDTQPDTSLSKVWQSSRANKNRAGAFHFLLQNKITPQVNGFVSAVNAAGMYSGGKWQAELPPCADVEVDWGTLPAKKPAGWVDPIQGAAWASQVKAFLDGIESALGIKPMIYTGQSNGWPRVCADGVPAWASQYLFWVKYYAKYPDNFPAFTAAMLPQGIALDQVVFWQYAEDGRGNGYPWNDLNIPTAQGIAMFGNAPAPTPTPTPTPNPTIYKLSDAWTLDTPLPAHDSNGNPCLVK